MDFNRTRTFNQTKDIDDAIRAYADEEGRTISDSIRILLKETLTERGYID